MKQINYENIASKLIKLIEEETSKKNHKCTERLAILCGMLDYLFEQQLITAYDSLFVHLGYSILSEIYPEYKAGCLSGDLLDFMIFDDNMSVTI